MIFDILSPLLQISVAMTSSLVSLHTSGRSSNTNPLPLRIAVKSLYLFLILYAGWLITIPPLSLGGCCRLITSALHSTPVSIAPTVHLYDLAQLCGITQIIGSEGSRVSSRGSRSHSLGLGHQDISCLPQFLFFLHISHLLFFAFPICCRFSAGSTTKHHSDRPRCRVHSFASGSLCCCCRVSALLPRFRSFSLLRAPAAECNIISFAIGALF